MNWAYDKLSEPTKHCIITQFALISLTLIVQPSRGKDKAHVLQRSSPCAPESSGEFVSEASPEGQRMKSPYMDSLFAAIGA
jgi:hypothetical protein